MAQIHTGAVIYAKEYLKIADFYKSITNLKVYEKEKTYVKLESDTFQLIVLQAPKRIVDSIDISVPPRRREETPIKIVFFVQSISKIREIVNELGGELNGEENIWNFEKHLVCDGCDPEGNVFQLREIAR
jgi:catechol-2,3-dioxygenase